MVSEPIRLLLADDQALVRGALAALLDLEPDLEVVAEVARGDEVAAAVAQHAPDVCLLDIEMPGADGIEACRAVVSSSSARVLIVTTFGRPGYLRRALDAGPPASWSRTRPPLSLPMPCGGCTRACGSSIPRWRPNRSSAARVR